MITPSRKTHKQQSGLALMTVIFLLVVISGAVVALAKQNQSSITQQNKALLAAKAELAGQSGLEWAIFRLINGQTCASLNNAVVDEYTNSSNAEVFSGFTITIECTQRSYTQSIDLYDVSAEAYYGTDISVSEDADYVWRKFTAVVEL